MQFSTPSRRACVVTVMLGLALLIANTAAAQIRTNGRIAFHSQRANFNFDIFTINPDGTGELQLTNSLANLSPRRPCSPARASTSNSCSASNETADSAFSST